jgi:hypothetical protein
MPDVPSTPAFSLRERVRERVLLLPHTFPYSVIPEVKRTAKPSALNTNIGEP